jgi:hypothetical protein
MGQTSVILTSSAGFLRNSRLSNCSLSVVPFLAVKECLKQAVVSTGRQLQIGQPTERSRSDFSVMICSPADINMVSVTACEQQMQREARRVVCAA